MSQKERTIMEVPLSINGVEVIIPLYSFDDYPTGEYFPSVYVVHKEPIMSISSCDYDRKRGEWGFECTVLTTEEIKAHYLGWFLIDYKITTGQGVQEQTGRGVM